MKQYEHIFGVDISKRRVDITCLQNSNAIHQQFSNDVQGMQALLGWLKELNLCFDQSIFCMEATGLYCYTLTNFLVSHGIDVWVEHAAQIKKATGLTRGKNDKVDSGRIAIYASKNLDLLRLWEPMNATLEKIKNLSGLRERLVETQKRLLVPIEEFAEVGNVGMSKLLTKSIKKSLIAIEKDISAIEKQIIDVINEDENLAKKYLLAKSVVGIGFVTAVNLLIYTHGFTQINTVRKLACYCGVAPFEYSSGTSIRGKTRVHFMANKKLKCNLHMASLSAVKLDYDLKHYYERKIAEGKNKMSVLNAIRNKLLSRVLSCVNNEREYVNKAA